MSGKNDIPSNIDINKADKVVAKSIDKAGEDDDRNIVLSSGVVLLAKPANPSMLIRAMTSQRRPTPPTYFSKEMGRDVENPDDPDYISRVQAWQMEYSNSMLNVLIGLGTELKIKPKKMPGPDDDQWISDYRSLGFPVILDSPAWRYITWVMYIAAPTQEDTELIGEKVRGMSGVKEADVRDAETFPSSD
jgi:hypothetical protein